MTMTILRMTVSQRITIVVCPQDDDAEIDAMVPAREAESEEPSFQGEEEEEGEEEGERSDQIRAGERGEVCGPV